MWLVTPSAPLDHHAKKCYVSVNYNTHTVLISDGRGLAGV